MILNNENYYSPEANQEYMSVSQYKAFMNCEAAAMASISGKYERPTTRALLVVLLSWLCAMVGYDKVIQAISQFKVHTSE